MSVTIVRTQAIAEGEITVFSNRDYIVIAGDPNDPEAVSTYYQAGHGPYHLQLLVDRLVTHDALERALEAGRGRSRTSRRPIEDEIAVPEHMRSSSARSRSSMRLADERTREDERRRRQRAALAHSLGERLGRLHAHLQYLISTEAHLPRFGRLRGADYTSTPGLAPLVPTDLQRAISSGLVIEGHPPTIADRQRGLGNDMVDALALELPGFFEQYENVFNQQSDRIWEGVLADAVMAVIDILDAIITLGASIAASAARQSLSTSARVLREGAHIAEEAAARRAGRVVTPDAVIPASEIPAGAIDATPRRAGSGTDIVPHADAPRTRPDVAEALPEPRTSTPRALPESTAREAAALPDSTFTRHGPLEAMRETALREIFGAERLRRLLECFQRLDEFLPEAIRTVFDRTNAGRIARGHTGLSPAAADATLQQLETRLREIIPNRAPVETDALTASQRSTAIEILREARRVARGRWNIFRRRLWEELYGLEEVRRALRSMERDGLIRLPRDFPNSSTAPRAIGGNRDGIIWLRAQEHMPSAQIGREFGISGDAVDGILARIRRQVAAGRAAPSPVRELPLNLDHITPVQLNPWNFFHRNNLRVINASFNDTWLRLYQIRSPFPMTDDALEKWVRMFDLY